MVLAVTFDSILFILACDEDNSKILDEFVFGLDLTTHFGVSDILDSIGW